jgi:serine/threonine protein kinase
VREIPAILLLYYDKQDHIKRKSYQGEADIRIALQNGELKRKFKEFIAERSLSEEDDDTDTKTASAEQHPGFSNAVDDDDSTATQEKSTSRPSTARQVSSGHIIKRQDIEVGDRIGQGRFGVVFQAMWKRKRVAVKTCAGNLLETGDAEVDILASLPPHPNVLKFFGVAVSEDKLHSLIVTELAAGGSLSATLHGTNREKPTAAQSLGWALQIASGMEHLHSHDIIHRDLKSPNVLLAHGYLKVCDFGTARHLSETCVPTGQAGTYRWMAPEIIEEHAKINKKCDVFSYGMMLYEIYEVKVPFAEIQSDMRVCYAIMEGKRPPIPAKLPMFLRPLLEDCWRKDSAQRPSFATIIMTIQTEFYEKE